MKAGEAVKLYANVGGHPMPECIWRKDGVVMKADKNMTMSEKDGVATLTIRKCDVDLSGQYTLSAQNEHGQSDVSMILRVKGTRDV